jgi:hypothetical protein
MTPNLWEMNGTRESVMRGCTGYCLLSECWLVNERGRVLYATCFYTQLVCWQVTRVFTKKVLLKKVKLTLSLFLHPASSCAEKPLYNKSFLLLVYRTFILRHPRGRHLKNTFVCYEKISTVPTMLYLSEHYYFWFEHYQYITPQYSRI